MRTSCPIAYGSHPRNPVNTDVDPRHRGFEPRTSWLPARGMPSCAVSCSSVLCVSVRTFSRPLISSDVVEWFDVRLQTVLRWDGDRMSQTSALREPAILCQNSCSRCGDTSQRPERVCPPRDHGHHPPTHACVLPHPPRPLEVAVHVVALVVGRRGAPRLA